MSSFLLAIGLTVLRQVDAIMEVFLTDFYVVHLAFKGKQKRRSDFSVPRKYQIDSPGGGTVCLQEESREREQTKRQLHRHYPANVPTFTCSEPQGSTPFLNHYRTGEKTVR